MTLSIAAAAEDSGERLALVLDGDEIGFGELSERVAAGSAFGTAAAAERGVVVGVATSRLETLVEIYAALQRSDVLVPLHPRWTPAERRRYLSGLELTAAAGEGWSREPVPAGWSALASVAEPAERPLAVLPTSGSSGAVKGVALSRRAFLAAATASAENLGWREDDRWLLSLPLAHVGGLSIVTRCLLARRAMVLEEDAQGFEPGLFVEVLERRRVTLASLVPTQLQRLLARQDLDLPPRVRAVLLGGAAASPELLAAAADRGWPVLTTYGLTEACSQVATQALGTVNRGELGVGRPVAGTEVRVRDGVLEVRGDTLMSGYVGPGGGRLTRDQWLTTGDLGRLDGAGHVFVAGRADQVIVTGGENVHPGEVEQALAALDTVRDCCVVGIDDERWGQRVAAAVTVPAGSRFASAEVEGRLRRSLAGYKLPRTWLVLGDLPLLPSGKVDRRRVSELLATVGRAADG